MVELCISLWLRARIKAGMPNLPMPMILGNCGCEGCVIYRRLFNAHPIRIPFNGGEQL